MNGGNWQAWRELLRAANVFTAVSNVVAGALIAIGPWPDPWALLAACVASVLLYEAGMVLNDAFDADLDTLERPERPIPSGRIDRQRAFLVGWSLLAAGVVAAAIAGSRAATPGPVVVALCLALMIVLYDSGLKQTWAGPGALGWCRTLNVLLGASLAAGLGVAPLSEPSLWVAAGGVGLYATALTWLAQSEVAASSATPIRGSVALAAASIAVLAAWGLESAPPSARTLWLLGTAAMLWVTLGGAPQLLTAPDPQAVRKQVGRMIVGFLVIDAYLAGISAGWLAAAAVALLIVPTRLAARTTPMT
jgi:hypothetical protein